MNPKPIEQAKNPLFAKTLPALLRARKRAEELAIATNTELVDIRSAANASLRMPKSSAPAPAPRADAAFVSIEAIVSRGDVEFRAGNLDSALSQYDRAISAARSAGLDELSDRAGLRKRLTRLAILTDRAEQPGQRAQRARRGASGR
jgi:hypothetical protein